MRSLQKEVLFGIISLFFCVGLVVFYTLQYARENSVPLKEQSALQSDSEKGPTSADSTQSVQLSLDEVAKHSVASNCWIMIRQNVYVVTDYINLHPGGAKRIVSFCGQDATSAFATQGGKGEHSQNAHNDLAKLMIGKVDTSVLVDLKQIKQAAQEIPVREEEEEEEGE